MDTGLKRPVAAVLLVAVWTWSVPAAAFCFSKGGDSRKYTGYFSSPVAPGFGAGWYPPLPYMAPATRAILLPAVIREQVQPADPVSTPEQHIFR
jgi:hypothetical protein